MIDKKRLKLSLKLIITFILLVIVINFTPVVFSKYETKTDISVNSKIAFYLLKEDYYTNILTIHDMIPREEAYVWTFTVSNYDNEKVAEVDLKYNLMIKATTNLPLEYELFLNDNDNNIVEQEEKVQDEYGTYFYNMKTKEEQFIKEQKKINTYTLKVYFKTTYINYMYQDIMENIEIIINSEQII